MTHEKTNEFVKELALAAKWLKYNTDKTKPIGKETGKHPPVTIPDNEMLDFIKLTSINSRHIIVLPRALSFQERGLSENSLTNHLRVLSAMLVEQQGSNVCLSPY